ncbi:hypothetical protein [Kaistella jeonii]|uniref:Preprotein translocase subunit SecB n=1 Tax=Kaistella jeonii TaxID=266749 RepID=A0A0C1D191_9FLAO|nr:hypothetical protein [Kaistella jeonii]KIA90496.1 hypothetical protein OA86_01005 [Kaistella jeonii]SFB71838.1 hypothetical protein SAMN05421876_101330 [Kaistella jeonii]VEI94920.1 Uncharacterised protein [Kaistella jeonii]
MKPILSPLILLDFSILNSNFHFIAPGDDDEIGNDLFSDYEIDLDFAIFNEDDTKIFVKVAINQIENPAAGYSIFAEGVAFFKLDESVSLSEDDKISLLQFSGFSITLNSLRGFITALTSIAPLGKYILPSIDVNDAFRQKSEKPKNSSDKVEGKSKSTSEKKTKKIPKS